MIDEVLRSCGKLSKRNYVVEGCDTGESSDPISSDCLRQYDLYIPRKVCRERDTVDILPLVFAVHCYGCSPSVMYYMHQIAEIYNFVLVIPHGLQKSFNAQNCCGYAVDKNIDDVGFLQGIASELSEEFENVVDKDIAYGFGWSNGGYMVTRAANLFRAIAPVSGYQVDLPPLNRPVGLFMHHSESDSNVRISGCCTDSAMPKCCCGLSDATQQCTSAMDFFQDFGATVNHCQLNGFQTILQTQEELNGKTGQIACYTAGSNCRSNTTFCVHEDGGHFNSPSFEDSFPMTEQVADFFARDACSIDQGSWDPELKRCKCRFGNNSATYCLSAKWEEFEELNDSFEILSIIVAAYWVILIICGIAYCKKQSRKQQQIDYEEFNLVPTLELSDVRDDENAPRPLSKNL